ncbi:BGTF surface domain-containing protein [Halobellus sp. EA9]|uniref:DUF7827 domain-containing protein n=1 Tax=Halobellus sp. EA9 TaxID=3421647 RepID=UPI003EB7EF33
MTRFTPQLRAVALATLILLSVFAGSVTFAGSTAAVSGTSTNTALTPTTVDEDTQTTHNFNYSFTGINTSGNTTLVVTIPNDFTIDGHSIKMKNESGDILNTTDQVGNELRVVGNSSTSTVYLAGSVTLTSPSVESDTDYTVDFTGTDDDGDSQSTSETLTVEDVPPLQISSIQAFDPTTVNGSTENTHRFNYSFTGVNTSVATKFEMDVPDEFTIEQENLVLRNASGGEVNSNPSQMGNSLTFREQVSTETAYLTGSIDLTSPAVPEGEESTQYTLSVNGTDPNGKSALTQETLTVEFDGGQPGTPSFESAIQYTQSDGTPVVEVAFSEDVQNFASNYALYVEGEGQLTNGNGIVSVNEAQGRAVIELDQTYSSEMTVRLQSGITDPDGNALDDTGNQSVTFAPTSVTAGGGSNTVFRGANVSVVASSTDTGVTIQGTDSDTDNYFFSGSTGTNSRVFIFRTSGRALGSYEADIDGEGAASIQLRTLKLELSVEDQNVTNLDTISGTVGARQGNREIRLELLNEDGELPDGVNERVERLSGQGEYDFSYNLEQLGLETGEYTIRVTDTTTGITVESGTITVREAGDAEATFTTSTVSEARGDVVAIPVRLENTREATIRIGNEDVGYEANVTVREGDGDERNGRVTIYFDTYAATTYPTGSFESENDLIRISDGDEIVRGEVSVGVSNLLDAELYPVEASIDGRLTDVAQINLRPRETIAIRSWTAPRNRYGNLDAPEDVRRGTDEGWVTRDSEIAFGDAVLYEIRATGLEGTLDARGEDTVTSEFYAFANGSKASPAAQFTVEQQDPGPNRDPLVLQLNASNSRVIADSENDTYYVVTRTGEFGPSGVRDEDNDGAIDPGENDYGSIDDEDDLRASFTVFGDDENDLDLTEGGDDEVVETTLSLTQAELTMNEPFNVTAASGQEVFGEATVAPGTELSVRVRSADGVRPAFLKTASTTVNSDGQFLVTLSFNDTEPGDGYTITVSDTGPASELQVDGTVQAVIPTATTDTPEETTISTTTTTTATPTDTTSPPTSATTTTEIPTVQTPTTTPGFGAVAAVVALLAAALLALRRERDD